MKLDRSDYVVGGPTDNSPVCAPAFMRLDVEKKSVSGPKRSTPIQLMNRSERQLLLQGTEMGYAWAFAVDQTSGKFSASMTDRAGSFVVFGSCTPL